MDLDKFGFVRLLDSFWLSVDMDNWYNKSIYQLPVLQFKVAQCAYNIAEPENS
jgi:hypothetical protein